MRFRERHLAPIVAILLALLAWEYCAKSELFASRAHLPPASAILAREAVLIGGSELWLALCNTLAGVTIGLSIALFIGLSAGVLIGASELANSATKVLIEFLRPIPSVALIPFAILLYGNDLKSKVFLVAYASVWPVLIHAAHGVRDLRPLSLDTARSFRIRTPGRLLHIALPSSLPYAFTGIRIASSIAVMLAVTAELIIGVPGLGKEISLARQVGDVTSVYAYILTTGLVGWGLNSAFLAFERRYLFWHHAELSKQ